MSSQRLRLLDMLVDLPSLLRPRVWSLPPKSKHQRMTQSSHRSEVCQSCKLPPTIQATRRVWGVCSIALTAKILVRTAGALGGLERVLVQ